MWSELKLVGESKGGVKASLMLFSVRVMTASSSGWGDSGSGKYGNLERSDSIERASRSSAERKVIEVGKSECKDWVSVRVRIED